MLSNSAVINYSVAVMLESVANLGFLLNPDSLCDLEKCPIWLDYPSPPDHLAEVWNYYLLALCSYNMSKKLTCVLLSTGGGGWWYQNSKQ